MCGSDPSQWLRWYVWVLGIEEPYMWTEKASSFNSATQWGPSDLSVGPQNITHSLSCCVRLSWTVIMPGGPSGWWPHTSSGSYVAKERISGTIRTNLSIYLKHRDWQSQWACGALKLIDVYYCQCDLRCILLAGEAYGYLDYIRKILGCIVSKTRAEELKILYCLDEEHHLIPKLASVSACIDIQRHTDEATASLSIIGDL